jgi:hypothetical protein
MRHQLVAKGDGAFDFDILGQKIAGRSWWWL